MTTGKKDNKIRGYLKVMAPAVIISFAVCFLVLLYAPLELYFSNKIDLWFDVYLLLEIFGLLFLLGFVLCNIVYFILWIINEKLYKFSILAGFVFFFCTYVQGNFLVGNLPALDGRVIEWSFYKTERISSALLWIVVVSGVILAVKFLHMDRVISYAKYASIFITLMLSLTIITLGIMEDGFERMKPRLVTNEYLYEYSEDTNFVIFLLDCFDSKKYAEIAGNHPEYEDILEDFTYYPNTVSAYPFTKQSIPYILSGEWFENQTDFTEYYEDVCANSPFLEKLNSQGYKLGFYEDEAPLGDESILRFENIQNTKLKVSSFWGFSKCVLKLAGYRYAPFELKRFCVTNIFDLYNFKQGETSETQFSSTNYLFYDNLKNMDVTYSKDKQFKFIHIFGPHGPYVYNEQAEYVYPGGTGSYDINVEATMTIVDAFLNKLKDAGVYDNSVIIIMSDHGYYYQDEMRPDAMGRQNALLFVKGINEKHAYTVSQAPISFEDLQGAFDELLKGKTDTEVFHIAEDAKRERRYLYYPIVNEDSIIYEYVQTGYATDEETMIPTGKEYKLQ